MKKKPTTIKRKYTRRTPTTLSEPSLTGLLMSHYLTTMRASDLTANAVRLSALIDAKMPNIGGDGGTTF